MDYKLLNKTQKDKMKAITNNEYKMEWENPEFMHILLGELPKIRQFQSDNDILDDIRLLEKELSSYNVFFSDKKDFISKISNQIENIRMKKSSWYGLNLYEIEECIRQHKFCLISGEGGIGKSFFIKSFEEQLDNKNIPHLCIYGKFEKNIDNIDITEIIKESENGFVFIVDAINEMSDNGKEELLNLLKELKKYPTIRIVITYRTNAIEVQLLEQYKEIAKAEYTFQGVSFESALSQMLKLSVPDVYMYEDILYSNNALLLSMLCSVLASEKLVNETENGIASVTFILEQYIKKSIGKVFKGSISCQSIDIWKDTKRIAQWMYKNNKKEIDKNNLLSIIKTETNYLPVMMQMGFLGSYESNSIHYFYFIIDSLTDFLITRSLFEDIHDKDFDKKVEIIKNKVKNLYNLEEAIIIAIFDNLSPNYEYIKKLLVATGLMERFQYATIVKIHFRKESIEDFLRVFKPNNFRELFVTMGGYTDKPFNCCNYLFKYYFHEREKQLELSKILSGYYNFNGVKGRLKNILYFTTLNNRDDRRDEEAYYFALLCCAAPNKDIRCLAMKLLYEVASKKDEFRNSLMEEYKNVSDFYIKESIIYVLTSLIQNDDIIKQFFLEIINKEDFISAKNIKRIALYLGDEYGYIRWNRRNLYVFKENAVISDYLNDILFQVDIRNRDFLPFRYRGKSLLGMKSKFLVNDKKIIGEINSYLENKYKCVCNGVCNGSMIFETKIMPEIEQTTVIETLDLNSFFESYETVLKMIFDFYQVSIDRESWKIREEDFQNSVYMKCVDIATGLYYGSLMCNYYTNQFVTYNSDQNSIGYEVYDPLEYAEDVILTSPIPTYQDFIERLGEYVIKNIEVPCIKNFVWVKNVELTRDNVLNLLEPIEINNNKWVMLAGRISLHEENKYDIKWKDTYNIWCCTSINETIRDDGNARYLTIELDGYSGSLRDYFNCNVKPWLCKNVKDICSQSDVFERTSLVLPPAELIKYFQLEVNVSDLSWQTSDGTKVIVCNNNKNSYYKDPIGSTVFIRKDYLDKYLEHHILKYFAFTERFIPETGYADETSLHFEILNGCIEKEILNNDVRCSDNSEINPMCEVCPYSDIIGYSEEQSQSDRIDIKIIKELLGKYGTEDDDFMIEN